MSDIMYEQETAFMEERLKFVGDFYAMLKRRNVGSIGSLERYLKVLLPHKGICDVFAYLLNSRQRRLKSILVEERIVELKEKRDYDPLGLL